MKKTIKLLLVAVTSIFILALIGFAISSFMIGGLFNPSITQKKMQDIFKKDYEKLNVVAEFICESQYDNIYIVEKEDITDLVIGDKKIIDAFEWINDNGYDVISRENNTIYFQRWSNLDSGRGICYVIDGEIPTLQFMTRYEKLDKEKWFYYEEDFNEWKRRNSD